MTDLDIQRMQERIEALAAQVESLRAQLSAMPSSDAPDANDFGGGGEPDWSGAMGKVPDGFIETPAIPPLPDTTAAKDQNRLQYKSLDDRGQDNAPPGVTQIHDFDESPLSNALKIQLAAVAATGTGPMRIRLLDPDGNSDFRTKWMIPVRRANGTGGTDREIVWVCVGGEVGVEQGGSGCAPTVTLQDLPAETGHPNGGVRITVTPCEGTATSKDVWNGSDGADGADGCTPTVTPAQSVPAEHGAEAYTITPCGSGAQPITVYHGKNGTDGQDGADGADGAPGPQGPAGCPPVVDKISAWTDLPLDVRQQIPQVDADGRQFDYAIQIISGMSWDGSRCAGGTTTYFPVYKGKSGANGADGCTPRVVPNTSGSGAHGDLACTIYPCGDGAEPIPVYNGLDGQNGAPGLDGCSPTISAGSTPSTHGDLAYTITPCSSGATPIPVYHGSNAVVSGVTTETATGGCRSDTGGLLFVADIRYVSGTGIQVRFCRLNITNGLVKKRELCDWSTLIAEKACT